jgi:hypothetical protein
MLTKFELREMGVTEGNPLVVQNLICLAVQGLTLPGELAQFRKVHILFSFVFGPSPKAHCSTRRGSKFQTIGPRAGYTGNPHM